MPGIEPSPDKLLQGRLFSYPDTQRRRLGANYARIPVNCLHATRGMRNHQRDGLMRVDANGGGAPNYSPNSYGGPAARPDAREAGIALGSIGARTDYPKRGDLDFEQAGLLYAVMTPDQRTRLVANLAAHMRGVDPTVQARQVGHFRRANEEYGRRVAEALGLVG
jgi:catalase